jgi:hypothetical protein
VAARLDGRCGGSLSAGDTPLAVSTSVWDGGDMQNRSSARGMHPRALWATVAGLGQLHQCAPRGPVA